MKLAPLPVLPENLCSHLLEDGKIYGCNADFDRCEPAYEDATGRTMPVCLQFDSYADRRKPKAISKASNDKPCFGCLGMEDATNINHGAGGLGDALLGLTAIVGKKLDDPDQRIIYRVHPAAAEFVRLFTGPDYVGLHTHDQNKDAAPDSDLQMNLGYNHEMRTKGALARWERYRDNIGAKQSVLPNLKDADRLREKGKDFEGAVLLAPFSTWSNREYPLHSWMTLEKLLSEAGYRCVLLDRIDSRFPDRHKQMKSECVLNASAERVTGIILNAACLVGCDSGLAHLSGIVGKPTIALCGQTRGEKIFGLYPNVTSLQGCLACDACYWQQPYVGSKCDSCCPSLASITPQRIMNEVDRLSLPPLADFKAVVNHQKLSRIRHELLCRRDVAGDVAEVGVYLGGTAKFISRFAPGVPLHLFDTFAGMPADDEFGLHCAGDFHETSMESVRDFVGNPYAVFHVGKFPDTAVDGLRFKFVHVDVDSYQGTKAAIEYFSPRMTSGGVMLFDDFGWYKCPGVAKALHESALRFEESTPGQAIVRF